MARNRKQQPSATETPAQPRRATTGMLTMLIGLVLGFGGGQMAPSILEDDEADDDVAVETVTYTDILAEFAESDTWARTTGTVNNTSIVEKSGEPDVYRMTVNYTYTVESGEVYTGNRLYFGHGLESYNLNSTDLQRLTAEYPDGQPVVVFYDPQNPERSVLDRYAIVFNDVRCEFE